MTTLLPYRTPSGVVQLCAVLRDEHAVALAWAIGSGTCHPFAELVLDRDPIGRPTGHRSLLRPGAIGCGA